MRTIGDEAGITADFTGGHVLRHTFGARLVRECHDIVLVAEPMGHARLEITQAYSLPTDADREPPPTGSLPTASLRIHRPICRLLAYSGDPHDRSDARSPDTRGDLPHLRSFNQRTYTGNPDTALTGDPGQGIT
ncbi:tyrosine-type recombinase/integrase [Micromonospora sp. NPDC004551]|uniref:tyrosine-type recombinase/integrase n=1 Tax=Micromonospora sp. NPDC004551 TaxID=3154284 RepID=UPI0033A1D7BB